MAVASLLLLDEQDKNISSIYPVFSCSFSYFPQVFFISFLILVFRVGGSPTREGTGYPTVFPRFSIIIIMLMRDPSARLSAPKCRCVTKKKCFTKIWWVWNLFLKLISCFLYE